MKRDAVQLEYGIAPPRAWRRLLKIGVIVVVAVISALGAVWIFHWGMSPTVMQNVSAAQAQIASLPADAQAISFFRGGWFDPVPLAFECDSSELAFREWVAARNWTLQQGGFTIRRFDASQISLTNGIYCSWRRKRGGVDAAYDRDSGRTFYHEYSR